MIILFINFTESVSNFYLFGNYSIINEQVPEQNQRSIGLLFITLIFSSQHNAAWLR